MHEQFYERLPSFNHLRMFGVKYVMIQSAPVQIRINITTAFVIVIYSKLK